MKSNKNNIDELIRQKLSGENIPYNDWYWENAQNAFKKFEAANKVSGNSNFSKLFGGMVSKVVLFTSSLVMAFGLTTDTNKNETFNKKLFYASTNIENPHNLKANSILTDLKSNEYPNNEVNFNQNELQQNVTKPTQNHNPENVKPYSKSNSHKTNVGAKTNTYFFPETDFSKANFNGQPKSELPLMAEENALNLNLGENAINEEKEVNNPLKFLPMLGLPNSKINSNGLLGKAKPVESFSKNQFYQMGLYAGLANDFKQNLYIINYGFLGSVNYQNGLSIKTGIGIQQNIFEKNIVSKQLKEIKEIIKVPVTDWEYFENTKTVWSINYSQGVAMGDSVQVTYNDSVLVHGFEEQTISKIDTISANKTISGRANYFEIPLQIHFTKPLGKISVGGYVGARIGFLNKPSIHVNTDYQIAELPSFRVGLETGFEITYWLKNNVSLAFSPSYYQTSLINQKFVANQINLPARGNMFGVRVGLMFDL